MIRETLECSVSDWDTIGEYVYILFSDRKDVTYWTKDNPATGKRFIMYTCPVNVDAELKKLVHSNLSGTVFYSGHIFEPDKDVNTSKDETNRYLVKYILIGLLVMAVAIAAQFIHVL